MTFRFSKLYVFFLSLLFALLCACTPQKPTSSEPDDPNPPAQEEPSAPPSEPEPLPEPEPEEEITGENTPISEGIWKIDTSYFSEHQMTVDSFFVAGNDKVLLFVSPLNEDGTVAESSSVYFFSLETGNFLPQHLDLGVVGIYPDRVYDDGTVSVVTMDSESYQYREIIFIDPQSASLNSVPIPSGGDIISLSVSPDKQYVAATTLLGLNVTSLDFSSVYLQIPNKTTPDGDELCPSPTDWSSDSRLLSFKTAIWESIEFPSIADMQTKSISTLETLAGSEVRFVGTQLFFSSWFPYLPCGFCGSDGLSAVQTPLSCVPDPSQLCVFSLSPGGSCLALAIQTDDGCKAIIADSRSGQVLSSLSLPVAFHEAFFTSDERTAVFSTASDLDNPKELYVMDFGW